MKIYENLISGSWTSSANTVENINPSNLDDVVGTFTLGTLEDVDSAVLAATEAFKSWSNSAPQVRADLLDAVGSAILAKKNDIGRQLAREEGKTLPEAIGETTRAGHVFKFFAGESLRITGEKVASVRPGIDVEMTREPLGVIGIITPWNFPIAIPAWKIAAALAYGNCVVFKPAGLTPASGRTLAELLQEHGCPPGVFNLVMGSGSVVGEAIAGHTGIKAVSFTGSESTGNCIAKAALNSRKKIQLEMGGKNPMVVMDDCDLDVAVNASLNGAYFSTGQRCTASSRLIVNENIHNQFVDQLVAGMKNLKVGDALDDDTQLGPVIDQRQLQSNLEYVELARKEGATVIGGDAVERKHKGFYQEPALFVDTDNNMRINREEIFGPCASVIRVSDFDEAIAVANDTNYGLSAGICTKSLKFSQEFKKRSEAGVVMVNLPTAGIDYHVAFGGTKGSSYGPREQGRYAVEFYTQVKTAYTTY